MSTPRLQNVDVPGDGNCGFYAFATGLIPILQRDIATGNQERLDKLENAIRHLSENDNTFAWDSFQNDIAEYCPPAEREKQIISHRTLDKFNRVLREILVTEQIESITEALKADSEADQENLYLMIMVNELIPLVQKELNEGNRQLFGNLHDCMLALCRKNPKDPTLFWDQFKRDIQEYKPGDLEKKQQIYNRFYRLLTGIKGTESQKFVYDELVKTFNTLFIDKLINQIKIEITSGSQTIIETLIADILKNNLRAITFTFDTLARDIRQNNKNMASKKLHELLGEQHISLFAKIFVKYKPLSSISRLEGNDIFNEIFGLLDYYININLKPNPDILQTTFARNKESNDLVKAAAKHLTKIENALTKAAAKAAEAQTPSEVKHLNLTTEEQECLKREKEKEIFLKEHSRHIYLKRKLLESTGEEKENTLIPTDSVLYQTIIQKSNNGEWATQNDLIFLAVFFKTSLLTYKDRETEPTQNKTNDAYDTSLPTIRVRNCGNTHWVTVFDRDDQNKVTYDLVKSEKLDRKIAAILSDDSEPSKLLSKTIAKLQRNQIPIEIDFIYDEKKNAIETANCESIVKLSQLKLLSRGSYFVLKNNQAVSDKVNQLTEEEIDSLNKLLDAKYEKQIEYTDDVIAEILSDDSEPSKLLSKTIAKLHRHQIPIEIDFIYDEKKNAVETANCESIVKLSQLKLLSRGSYVVLKNNQAVFDEVNKLTAEQIDRYNQLLNAAYKKQIEFTGDMVEAMFTSPLGIKRYIQVESINKFIEQEKQKEKPGIDLRFWKSFFNDRMMPLKKLGQFLNGDSPGFFDHDIATLRQSHSEFMHALQIKMPRFEPRSKLKLGLSVCSGTLG